MVIKSIVSILCIVTVVYGMFKKSRLFFNLGYFIFGLFIVYDQLSLFIENNKLAKLISDKDDCDFYSTNWKKNESILLNNIK